jgi:hypothetical protein
MGDWAGMSNFLLPFSNSENARMQTAIYGPSTGEAHSDSSAYGPITM